MTDQITPVERIRAAADALGLTMSSTFVPFSASRHAKPAPGEPEFKGLNWRVTLYRAPFTILTTDYTQGTGHTPAGRAPDKAFERTNWPTDRARQLAIAHEIETGRTATWAFGELNKHGGKPIPGPDIADVLASLARNADVLDAGGFEPWAESIGYDTDSRRAEATYRECLELALKLRAAIGDQGIEDLINASEDY